MAGPTASGMQVFTAAWQASSMAAQALGGGAGERGEDAVAADRHQRGACAGGAQGGIRVRRTGEP